MNITPTARIATRWFPPVRSEAVPKITGPITAAVCGTRSLRRIREL